MSPFRNRNLWSLTFAHFVVDVFSGAVPLLLAAQTTPLHLSQGQVGLIALAFSLATSLAQPLFGLLADGAHAPLLGLAGVLWQALFIGLAGLAGRFETLLALVALGGLGSAAFHPPGAGGVPRISTSAERGTAMAIFLLGGNGGYAFGPLLAGIALNALGPGGTLSLTLATAAITPLLFISVSRLRYGSAAPASQDTTTPPQTSQAAERVSISGILSLGLLITFRAWTSGSLTTYLPQYFVQQGLGVLYAGQVSFVSLLASACGGFTAGLLSDRIGRHRVIIASLLAAAPLVYVLLHVSGIWIFVVAAALGFSISASLPLTLLIGQDIAPHRPGIMTGLTLGFTFVAGGIGTMLTGVAAERVGLQTALSWLPVLPLLAEIAALALSRVKRAADGR